MRLPLLTSNLGIKLLALALAIVLYYALKTENSRTGENHDARLFHEQPR